MDINLLAVLIVFSVLPAVFSGLWDLIQFGATPLPKPTRQIPPDDLIGTTDDIRV